MPGGKHVLGLAEWRLDDCCSGFFCHDVPAVIHLLAAAGPKKQSEDVRVGLPEESQIASIYTYTRGSRAHETGIPLAEIDWYQAGVNHGPFSGPDLHN